MFTAISNIAARKGRDFIASSFLALGAFYCLANMVFPHSVCDSFGCRAVQSVPLWCIGFCYCVCLFLAKSRKRGKLYPALVAVGVVVECGLVFYQVLLGLFCLACLGFGLIFLFFLLFVPDLPSRVRTGIFVGGFGFVVLVGFVSFVLSDMNPVVSGGSSANPGVLSSSHGTAVVFEPQCPHCHKLMATLRAKHLAEGIAFCPQAWSMSSVAKLANATCGPHWSAACVIRTLVLVRANNRCCSRRGISSVPALVENGKILEGEGRILAYLAARDRNPSRRSSRGYSWPADRWNGSWGGSGGACTAGEACE